MCSFSSAPHGLARCVVTLLHVDRQQWLTHLVSADLQLQLPQLLTAERCISCCCSCLASRHRLPVAVFAELQMHGDLQVHECVDRLLNAKRCILCFCSSLATNSHLVCFIFLLLYHSTYVDLQVSEYSGPPSTPAPPTSPAATCSDIAPDSNTCAQQKQWGKCNAGWLTISTSATPHGYCAKTCGRC